ncbi:type II toxin-antitoxin system CcdA family antitoxin [Methylibium sp.]|uniref:type II toxin-antitoxin system CcdA family antitoxin n=1 Tax=Methylibium sp. TaxID=2067992 RepID=UPI0017A0C51F|nr:type II toxin-antitoxin system CcdA family antitoxin [Methylibium sp.]MBA3591167.1 type II toxin-antitoxin system CcdA family antitoxin [Methylibium sp.]
MRRFANAPKRAVNFSLNSAVLDLAKELQLNISQTVDRLLAVEVERVYWERWRIENAHALEHYNARIEKEGLFSDRHRTFMRPDADQSTA